MGVDEQEGWSHRVFKEEWLAVMKAAERAGEFQAPTIVLWVWTGRWPQREQFGEGLERRPAWGPWGAEGEGGGELDSSSGEAGCAGRREAGPGGEDAKWVGVHVPVYLDKKNLKLLKC